MERALKFAALWLACFMATTLVIAACSSPAPTPAPTPDVEATALAVVEANQPTPQPVPTEVVIEPVVYPDDDIRVYMGDEDVSGQIEEAGGTIYGYQRGSLVTVVWSVPNSKLSDDVGQVYVIPRFAHPYFEYGGVGPDVVGNAVVGLRGFNPDVVFDATCFWSRTPHGEDAISFQFIDENGVERVMRGAADTNDHPAHFHYAPFARCTIQVP